MTGTSIFQRDQQGRFVYVPEQDDAFLNGNEQQRTILNTYFGPALEAICNEFADKKQLLSFLEEIIRLFKPIEYDATRYTKLYTAAQKQFGVNDYNYYVAPFMHILLLPQLSYFSLYESKAEQFFGDIAKQGSLSGEPLWKDMQQVYFERLVALTSMLELEQKSLPRKIPPISSLFSRLFGIKAPAVANPVSQPATSLVR